jgi:flotillin
MVWFVLGIGLVVALVALALVVGSYRRVGLGQALLILGFGGTRVVTERGAVVWPVVQQAWLLSLAPWSVEASAPERDAGPLPPPLPTADGPGVRVEAIARVRIEPNVEILRGRSGGFVTQPAAEQQAFVRQLLAEQLSRVVAGATVPELATDPATVEARVRDGLAADVQPLGLVVEAVILREVAFEGEARARLEQLRP